MRPYGTQQQLEKRRRQALELLYKGIKPPDVARKIGCSLSSVYYWDDIRKKQGDEGLKAKPVPGRPDKLSKPQKHRLTNVLLKGALSNGYSTDLWTTKRVAEVIEDGFGITYHPNHVWRILQGLGWSCQKPEKRSRERDEKEVAHWKRYVWPHIKKRQKTWSPACLPR